jgi:hypothetical protein
MVNGDASLWACELAASSYDDLLRSTEITLVTSQTTTSN